MTKKKNKIVLMLLHLLLGVCEIRFFPPNTIPYRTHTHTHTLPSKYAGLAVLIYFKPVKLSVPPPPPPSAKKKAHTHTWESVRARARARFGKTHHQSSHRAQCVLPCEGTNPPSPAPPILSRFMEHRMGGKGEG